MLTGGITLPPTWHHLQSRCARQLPPEGAKDLLIIRMRYCPQAYLLVFTIFSPANASAPFGWSWLRTSFCSQTEGGSGLLHTGRWVLIVPQQYYGLRYYILVYHVLL